MHLEDLFPFFEGGNLIHLANIDENNHPRVRMVSLIFYDNQFWFCSPKNRPKVGQFAKKQLLSVFRRSLGGEVRRDDGCILYR